jgi:N-carbamoyl-L-amino-acid hydrolase
MVFIPCKEGLSHHEAESITEADAAAGARVLTDVAWSLADEA